MLAKLGTLFSAAERGRLFTLLAMMTAGALLEILGIGLIAPIVGLIADPEATLAHAAIRQAYEWSGARSSERFAIGLLLCFVALIVLKNAYLLLVAHVQFRFVYAKQAEVSQQLFRRALAAPYEALLQRHTADLTRSFATEINNVFSGVLVPLLSACAEAIVLAMMVAMLLVVMPGPALLALAGGAVLLGAAYQALRTALGRHGLERAALSRERLRTVSEALGGLKELKVLGREERFAVAFAEANGRYLQASRVFATLNSVPRLAIEALSVVALSGAALAVAAADQAVRSALPSIALLCAAALRLMPAGTRILGAVASIRFYAPALDQVTQDLRFFSAVAGAQGSGAHADPLELSRAIQIRGVSFRYPGANRFALRDVSLEIPAGAVCGLAGASGAGKSTLADVVLGLLTPTEGSVLVDGRDIRQDIGRWRRSVAYVPQSVHLLDDSVRRNVAFGLADADIDDGRVWAALEAAQLAEVVRRRPAGLDEVVGERGVRFSGGQKQRLGIARALYGAPRLLVLDEATSALDLPTEAAIADAIFGLRGRCTLLIIAHRLETLRRCDWVVFMEEGEARAQGTFDQLVARDPAFAALAGRGAL